MNRTLEASLVFMVLVFAALCIVIMVSESWDLYWKVWGVR